MAKKRIGSFVAFAAIAGAAAAGISYLVKYKSFSKELDEDFHDFEEEEDGPVPNSTMNRNYVSLHADKDEFLVAAGDMLNAAKDAAGAAKNVVKGAAAIVVDTTRDAMSAASDTAASTKSSFNETAGEVVKTAEETMDTATEAVKDVAEDITTTITEDMENPDI